MHDDNCRAIVTRTRLLNRLQAAVDPKFHMEPPMTYRAATSEEVDLFLAELTGILREYHDDGDQVAEECSCHVFNSGR